jgi:hypothetical protein
MERTAVLQQVQENLGELLSRRAVPFADLARHLKPTLLPSGNSWCDVLYAFQNLPQERPAFTALAIELEPLTLPRGQHPLKVEFVRGDTAYLCRIEYACEVLAQEEARALLAAIRNQVAELAAAVARNS